MLGHFKNMIYTVHSLVWRMHPNVTQQMWGKTIFGPRQPFTSTQKPQKKFHRTFIWTLVSAACYSSIDGSNAVHVGICCPVSDHLLLFTLRCRSNSVDCMVNKIVELSRERFQTQPSVQRRNRGRWFLFVFFYTERKKLDQLPSVILILAPF